MNQTNIKVDPDDKKMKLDRFMVKKIILGMVRRDQFLYLSFRFDYKFSLRLLQYFSLDFSILCLIASFSFYTFFFFHPHPPCAGQIFSASTLSHQHLLEVLM